MTPATLLHLWRDRWHLPQHPEHSVPLVHGRIARWTMDLARSDHWGLPGLIAAVLTATLTVLVLAVTTRLSTNSQIVLGWSLVVFAIYLRRHRGQVVALAIVCMAALLGLRYFYWRAEATLPPSGTGNWFLALALICAELLVWLRTGLDYFISVWPVESDSSPLPDDAVTWPTVDFVYVPTHDAVESTVAFLSGLSEQDWPRNKYRTVILSAHDDASLHSACAAKGVTLRVYPQCAPDDIAALVNRFMYESEAELLVVADCAQQLPPDFLRNTMGWFVQEPLLALAQTPRFPLSQRPRRIVQTHLLSFPEQPALAVVRRTSLLAVGGLRPSGSPLVEPTDRALGHSGFFDAFLLYQKGNDHQSHCKRLDGPSRPLALPLRIQLKALREGLHFYAPITTGIFWVIPFAALGLGATVIAADFWTLAAYWVPQWVLGRLALATALEHHRLRWWDFVKEELGAIAVLVRTTRSFTATRFLQLPGIRKSDPLRALDRLPKTVPITHRPWVWVGILVFGLVSSWGLHGLWTGASPILAPLYVAWSAFLMMSLLAELAVQRELDWVQAHRHACAQLPCMVRLVDDGSVFRTTTTNFPEHPLTLDAAHAAQSLHGQTAQISIFLGAREFVFPCRLATTSSEQVVAEIPAQFLSEFRGVAALALSRPSRWPMWLPPVHADRLLPRWLERILLRLQDAFYNLTVKYTLPAVMQRIRARIFPGSSTHG
ncbi:hypothetical protein RQP54_04180 [Curvibacter sp. APW13]|uniref:hypothetical protein n=1 Tax=Curvibacter sp. APW13 TaxID=3077236 RepID=UPI0028DD5FD8|nr:hypothetical protein [Curvibacter sp. APW13]MDT8990052.1 hypothetical protein [Curvibacter sp. APW13]